MSKEEIEHFYRITLIDIREGVSLEELEEILKLYEAEENYYACAGIHKAIQEARHQTIINLRNDREY